MLVYTSVPFQRGLGMAGTVDGVIDAIDAGIACGLAGVEGALILFPMPAALLLPATCLSMRRKMILQRIRPRNSIFQPIQKKPQPDPAAQLRTTLPLRPPIAARTPIKQTTELEVGNPPGSVVLPATTSDARQAKGCGSGAKPQVAVRRARLADANLSAPRAPMHPAAHLRPAFACRRCVWSM